MLGRQAHCRGGYPTGWGKELQPQRASEMGFLACSLERSDALLHPPHPVHTTHHGHEGQGRGEGRLVLLLQVFPEALPEVHKYLSPRSLSGRQSQETPVQELGKLDRKGKADNEGCVTKDAHMGCLNITPPGDSRKRRHTQASALSHLRGKAASSALSSCPDWGRVAFPGFRESLRPRNTGTTGSWKLVSGP